MYYINGGDGNIRVDQRNVLERTLTRRLPELRDKKIPDFENTEIISYIHDLGENGFKPFRKVGIYIYMIYRSI